jgi:hypothetical protein
MQSFRAAATFGGLTLFVKSDAANVELHIPDESLAEVLKRGLERLSGQGKVDQELFTMCHCIGQITP